MILVTKWTYQKALDKILELKQQIKDIPNIKD